MRFRVKRFSGHDGALRIGQVAESAGVTVEALRFYERRGLLPAPARTSSGYRDYPTRTVEVVLRVANDITSKITSGAYPTGFKLPSNSELAEQYHIGKRTAFRAVKVLHGRELVYGQQGQGVFVL